jgi:shikimate dehydrogenase
VNRLPDGLSAATTVVGVIGDPVAHSLSPLLHNTAFAELGLDWVSVGFPVSRGAAGEALTGALALGVRGLSVTMPHKDVVAGLVDELSPRADRLGAVNCVVNRVGDRSAEASSLGDNTDGPGLVAALRHGDRFEPAGQRCLVIGWGGAARAVVAALADAGAAEVIVVNRTPERAASAAALAGPVGRVGVPADATTCHLVVNATSIGMAGPTGAEPSSGSGDLWPLDPALIVAGQQVVDLVYHPRVTPWLEAAQRRGAVVSNGLGMLVHQAALQLTIWTSLEPPVDAMWRAATGFEPPR